MADAIEPITGVNGTLPALNTAPTAFPVSAAVPADAVVLSYTAQATLLQGHGESPEEIAATLGLSTSQVLADLGIAGSTTAVTTSIPVAAAVVPA
jgi:hypothetical protein